MEPILSVSVKFPLSVWPCLRHVQVLHPAAADFVVWMSSVDVLGAGTYALKTHVYQNMYPGYGFTACVATGSRFEVSVFLLVNPLPFSGVVAHTIRAPNGTNSNKS